MQFVLTLLLKLINALILCRQLKLRFGLFEYILFIIIVIFEQRTTIQYRSEHIIVLALFRPVLFRSIYFKLHPLHML